MIIGNVDQNIQDIQRLIESSYCDLIACYSMGLDHKVLVPKQIRWDKPDVGQAKLNSDGSFLGLLHKLGFGGLLRDENGSWIHGYSGSLDRDDVLGEIFMGQTWFGLGLDTWFEEDFL